MIRIDDLQTAPAAFDPQVHPPRPDSADVGYVIEETAVGRLLISGRHDGTLLTCSYASDDTDIDRILERLARQVTPRVLRGGSSLDPTRRQLDEYLTGRRHTFDVRTDLALARPFQRRVLTHLASTVGFGRTTTYGTLAAEVGQPTASRAVGAALGANPLCVVLPCHRVVAASGALTGYAGGLEAKRLLLALERSEDI